MLRRAHDPHYPYLRAHGERIGFRHYPNLRVPRAYAEFFWPAPPNRRPVFLLSHFGSNLSWTYLDFECRRIFPYPYRGLDVAVPLLAIFPYPYRHWTVTVLIFSRVAHEKERIHASRRRSVTSSLPCVSPPPSSLLPAKLL